MPKVLNKYRDEIPLDAIFIGRPSEGGNPFVIGKDGSRAEVLKKYEVYFFALPWRDRYLKELVGRDLVCFCAPLPCHGDFLLKLANQFLDKE